MNERIKDVLVPPNDIEAEKSLIGCVLSDNDSIEVVGDDINPEDFYDRNLGLIYEVSVKLNDKGQRADIVTVSSELKKKDIELSSLMAECLSVIPSIRGLKDYARIVKENRILRDALNQSITITEYIHSKQGSIDDILDMAWSNAEKLSGSKKKKRTRNIGELANESVEKFKKINSGEIPPGIPTGLKKIDDALGGLHRGDLVIIGARASVGKSALATTISDYISRSGVVAFFSLEMSSDQVSNRFISINSRVPLYGIMNGVVKSASDIPKLEASAEELRNRKLEINDSPSITVSEIQRTCRRIKSERKGLDLIVVDYIQLIKPRKDDGKTNDQIGEISRSLKILAKELDVPVIALSQLSRNIEQRENNSPRLSDLRDSGSLEADADIVIVLTNSSKPYSDNYEYDYLNKEAHILKHRNGKTGMETLKWDPETASFS